MIFLAIYLAGFLFTSGLSYGYKQGEKWDWGIFLISLLSWLAAGMVLGIILSDSKNHEDENVS